MHLHAIRPARARSKSSPFGFRDQLPRSADIPWDTLMTNSFIVIGERRDDPDHLLVLGDDGAFYDYVVETGQALPVEPDATWLTDGSLPEVEESFGF
jgi:hypothetical protein